MKDVFGNEVNVGDTVAVIVTGYSTLAVGPVLRLTPKKIVVEVPRPRWLGGTEERYATSNQVAKRG